MEEMENLHYIDEYPDLQKRLWMRRLYKSRQLGEQAVSQAQVIDLNQGRLIDINEFRSRSGPRRCDSESIAIHLGDVD